MDVRSAHFGVNSNRIGEILVWGPGNSVSHSASVEYCELVLSVRVEFHNEDKADWEVGICLLLTIQGDRMLPIFTPWILSVLLALA